MECGAMRKHQHACCSKQVSAPSRVELRDLKTSSVAADEEPLNPQTLRKSFPSGEVPGRTLLLAGAKLIPLRTADIPFQVIFATRYSIRMLLRYGRCSQLNGTKAKKQP